VDTIEVPARFNGPRDSGNGGYTCGLVAAVLGDGPAEVTLKAPPPLDRPLSVQRVDGGVVARDGEVVVAEGRPVELELDPLPPVAVDVAAATAPGGPFLDPERHPYPSCFVCGPTRAEGDGLRIFAGPVDDSRIFAAAWTPPLELAGPDGRMPDEIVWAALDCPSSGPVANHPGMPGFMPIVLGRLAARIDAPVVAGEPHVVMAWELGVDGRKRHSAAALYSPDGELCAVSRALWLELKAPIGGGS
jgi:hypothetical protein